MNILQELSKVKKKHCYFYAEQNKNELPFSLELNLNDTLHQTPYDETYQPLTNVHIEQRKLLLSEIQLMNEYYKTYGSTSTKTPLILYIGSAPGIHLPYLHTMYPKLKFVLYDGATFDETLYKSNDIYEIHDGPSGFFTTEKARELINKYENYDLLFVCDFRLSSDNINEFEQNVMKDMRNQEQWVRILNPLISLLKFRTPYYMYEDMTYMSGKLLYGIWRSPKSTESRLLTHQSEINVDKLYNGRAYENSNFFNTKYSRPFAYRKAFQDFPKYIIDTNMYCPCYDCYSELMILKEYETIISLTKTNLTNMDDAISLISQLSPQKFWSKIWEDNISIEKQFDTIDTEPYSIVGIKRNLTIENNNILIIIPKVNIYNLDNFETLFTEFIDDFYRNISKVRFDNMMYYKIVILEQVPFKEQILYGALLNSAYTIAKYSENKYNRILFNEPFLLPNRKLFELYLNNSIKDDIIIYSNIYKSVNQLAVFSIKTERLNISNGYPNNISDVLMCNKILLERIKRVGSSIYYVSSNNMDNNSIFFNLNYQDTIADIRPAELLHQLSNEKIDEFNNLRNTSNYDKWCGSIQKYYFNTENMSKYINLNGDETEIINYVINLHNSCDLYNGIDDNMRNMTKLSIGDINRELISFMKKRIDKYLFEENISEIGAERVTIEYNTDENYIGRNICFGEFIENLLNIIEETYYFISNMRSEDENTQKIIKLIIENWYSYINIERDEMDIRKYTIILSDPSILVNEMVTHKGITNLNRMYIWSQEQLSKTLIRSLFYESDERKEMIIRLLYKYQQYTYMNMIIHNINIRKVDNIIEEFEGSIN